MKQFDIAVVGAGFTGTLLSWHLAKAEVGIAVIGEGETFGLGRASSTERAEHLLNVPAGGMSAFPEDPDHFRDWLSSTGLAADPWAFMPRQTYGRYLQSIYASSNAVSMRDVVHLLDRLMAAGHICCDVHGLGILSDSEGHCLTADGGIVPRLYATGPLRRGMLWENIAVPELRKEAQAMAHRLALKSKSAFCAD